MAGALRPGAILPAGAASAGLGALATLGGAVGAAVIVVRPDQMRLVFALLVFAALLALLLSRPQAGLVAVVGWLMAMAAVRRLLIEPSGWTSYDPLLLVGPALAVVMALKLFALDGRPLAPDALSKWVLAVLFIAVLQVLNPLGGGVATGLGGLLFVGVPLLWFLVGRELATDATVVRLAGLTFGAAVLVGTYGLLQTELGFPAWDEAWLAINGYVSLNVGDTVRAFGTFSSSAEYALVLGAGVAIGVAFLLRGRAFAGLALPVVAIALFLASGRSALILGVVASIVVVALNTRRPAVAGIVIVVALGGAAAGLTAFAGKLSGAAAGSGDLAAHQLGGLSDPLDPSSSTLLLHTDLLVAGLQEGIRSPLGHGTGATNSAAGKLGGAEATSLPTEIDVSNAFVSLGLVGGIAYLGVVLTLLGHVGRLAFAGRFAALPVAAVLCASAGQWLIGGNYALCTLLWIMAGWTALGREDPA